MKDLTKIKVMLLFIAIVSFFALLFSMITIDVKTEKFYEGKIIKISPEDGYSIRNIEEENPIKNITCSDNVYVGYDYYYGVTFPIALQTRDKKEGICVYIVESEKTIYDGRWKWEK